MKTENHFPESVLGPVLAAVLITGAGCGPGDEPSTADDNAASQFGSYTREATYDGAHRDSVDVPMSDDVRIAVDYFVPTAGGVEASEPLPTILRYTRYTRAALFADENGEQQLSAEGERNPLLQHMLHHDEGNRLRLTIAGADAANHALYPDAEGVDAPTISIHRGGNDGSWLDVPVARPASE